MTRAKLLSVAAIVLWLIFGSTLWPLPPEEARLHIQIIREGLVKLRNPSPAVKAEPEWERVAAGLAESRNKLQELLENADDLETSLWLGWASRFGLFVLGITAWTLFSRRVRFWQSMVVTSTLLYVLLILNLNVSTYESLFTYWLHGETGFAFAPWSFVFFTIYYNFAMPLLLVLFTALAFLWGRPTPLENTNEAI